MSSSAHILVSGFPVSCAYFLYCYFLYCSVDLSRFPAIAFLTLSVEEVVLPCVLPPNRAAGLTGFFEYPPLFGGNLQHRDSAPCMHCHFVHPQLHDSLLFYFTPYHLGTTLLSSTSRSTQRNSFVLLQWLFFLQWWELLLLPTICSADPNRLSST